MASVIMGMVQEVGDSFIRLGVGSQIRVPSAVWKPELVVGVRVSVTARLLGSEWIADEIVLEEQPHQTYPRVQMDQGTLRSLILAKLIDGRLARDTLPRVWGAAGDGQNCAACDQAVTKNQIMIGEGLRADDPTRRFHIECFSILDQERRRR